MAGAVLVTPGVVTDLVGFALLIAPLRRRIRRGLAKAFKRRVVMVSGKEDLCPTGGGAGGDEPAEFIDVEATSARAAEGANEPDRLDPNRGR